MARRFRHGRYVPQLVNSGVVWFPHNDSVVDAYTKGYGVFVFGSGGFMHVFPCFFARATFFFYYFFGCEVASQYYLYGRRQGFQPSSPYFLSHGLFRYVAGVFRVVRASQYSRTNSQFCEAYYVRPASGSYLGSGMFRSYSIVDFRHRYGWGFRGYQVLRSYVLRPTSDLRDLFGCFTRVLVASLLSIRGSPFVRFRRVQ